MSTAKKAMLAVLLALTTVCAAVCSLLLAGSVSARAAEDRQPTRIELNALSGTYGSMSGTTLIGNALSGTIYFNDNTSGPLSDYKDDSGYTLNLPDLRPTEEEALQEEKGSGEEQEDGESQEQREVAGKEQTGRTDEGKIWVYVCGQVASPGVYELPEESRIYEAVESAGGILEQGAAESVNLAEKASDGQRIYIPSKEEAAAMPAETPDEGSSGGMNDERVNLNTADKEELMTLTGIGETRAEAILTYREENGSFHSPEDIMNVQGIKEGIYEKIKEQIKTE